MCATAFGSAIERAVTSELHCIPEGRVPDPPLSCDWAQTSENVQPQGKSSSNTPSSFQPKCSQTTISFTLAKPVAHETPRGKSQK
jgi:hypothetical protein